MDATRLFRSHAPRATLLVRLAVGGVFLVAGTLKFLDPEEYGTGRFAELGFPSPEVVGPLVGTFEVACGLLVLLGLVTRLAALPLVAIMLAAIAVTKVPTLLDNGFWEFANDARLDFSMLMTALFLAVVGAGPWSLDALLGRRFDRRMRGEP
jgi:putative oxidoreductase